MKPYFVSLLVGALVGALYALLRTRSPAPPVIALVGLLGMLIGEQCGGLALDLIWPEPPPAAPFVHPASVDPSSSLPGNRHAP